MTCWRIAVEAVAEAPLPGAAVTAVLAAEVVEAAEAVEAAGAADDPAARVPEVLEVPGAELPAEVPVRPGVTKTTTS